MKESLSLIALMIGVGCTTRTLMDVLYDRKQKKKQKLNDLIDHRIEMSKYK